MKNKTKNKLIRIDDFMQIIGMEFYAGKDINKIMKEELLRNKNKEAKWQKHQ